jgi:preprotein translocase subunit YajC
MFATPAFAQTAGGAAATGGGLASFLGLAPLFLVFIVFYILMIRPQQRRMRDLQRSVTSVKKGDEVVTAGGHIGRVTKVTDDEVEVEFAAGQRHRVVKSTLAEVRPLGGKPAND